MSVCNDCGAETDDSCDTCHVFCCVGCLNYCDDCSNHYCNEECATCSNCSCGLDICPDCVKACSYCSNSICDDCTSSCITCDEIVCTDCERQCDYCSIETLPCTACHKSDWCTGCLYLHRKEIEDGSDLINVLANVIVQYLA